jgi:hypothetical protein
MTRVPYSRCSTIATRPRFAVRAACTRAFVTSAYARTARGSTRYARRPLTTRAAACTRWCLPTTNSAVTWFSTKRRSAPDPHRPRCVFYCSIGAQSCRVMKWTHGSSSATAARSSHRSRARAACGRASISRNSNGPSARFTTPCAPATRIRSTTRTGSRSTYSGRLPRCSVGCARGRRSSTAR